MSSIMKSALAALVLGLTATSANATLVHSDWQTAGDQLITVDTNSGLQWLNFSQTTIGHQAIRDSLSTVYEGFRFANAGELFGLFSSYVPGIPTNGFLFGNNAKTASDLQFVMDALGYDDNAYRFVNTCEHATGCDPLGFGAGEGIHRHLLVADLNTSDFNVFFNDDIDFAQVQALVKEVPEPGSLGLALLAGFMLVAVGRRRPDLLASKL
jgi:hypothetical protein